MDSVMDDVNAESYGKPVARGGGRRLTRNDALAFLKLVKDTFHDKEKYTSFIDILKDFKAKRTDTAGVVVKVKELFKGHNHLMLGFNTFLPKGFKTVLNETDDIGDAIGFVEEVKKCYANDHHVYATFLDILQKYLKVRTDEKALYNEVAMLFDKHPDLVDEFTRFLHPRLQQMHLDKKRDSVYGSEVDDVKAMLQVLKEQMQTPKEDIMDHDNNNNGTILSSLLDLFRRLTT